MVKKQAYTGSSQKGKLTRRIDSPDDKDIGCVATLRNPHQQHVEGLYKREGGRDQTNSIGLTLPLVAVVPRLFLCALFFDWKDVHLVPRLQISTLQRQYNILKKLLTFSPQGQSGHERQKVMKKLNSTHTFSINLLHCYEKYCNLMYGYNVTIHIWFLHVIIWG